MSLPGRTSWLPRDAATHDRELVVELGEEFGSDGPYVLTVLGDLAQQQRAGGTVRTGYRILARKSFTEVETVRLIIERAGEIGALDDLEVDADGRRFTCRISGWKSDQDRAKAAWKKAQQRADKRGQEGDMSPVGPDPSRNVPLHDHNQTIETATACEPPSLGAAVEEPPTVVASGKQARSKPSKRVDHDKLPDGLPDDLVRVAGLIYDGLCRLQDLRGGGEPTLRAAGLIAQHFPDRDHEGALADLEHWTTAGRGAGRHIRDWAATYRGFAKGAARAPSAGVLPIRPRTEHGGDLSRFDGIGEPGGRAA